MRESRARVLTGLGEALEAARKAAQIPTRREAALRAGLSPATWTNTLRGGVSITLGGITRLRPHRPSDETVRAAATAVGLDVECALTLPREAVTEQPRSVAFDLTLVPTDDLWDELRRRSA